MADQELPKWSKVWSPADAAHYYYSNLDGSTQARIYHGISTFHFDRCASANEATAPRSPLACQWETPRDYVQPPNVSRAVRLLLLAPEMRAALLIQGVYRAKQARREMRQARATEARLAVSCSKVPSEMCDR